MKKIFLILYSSFFIFHFSFSQNVEVYPSHWWVGMKWNKVQLLARDTEGNFTYIKVRINYPGIKIDSIHRLENKHYLAIDISIAPNAKPGNVEIEFIDADFIHTTNWR